MQILEDNYISVVLATKNQANIIEKVYNMLILSLKDTFKNFEVIIVDNGSTDNTMDILSNINDRLNIIHLPFKHDGQQALNAGTSIAIGDYIVEIESIEEDMNFNLIRDMYFKCQEGYDFVFLTPSETKLSSRLFYNQLNKYFKNQFPSNITSTIMTLSSRRGQNKAMEVGGRIVNRNVHYLVSGLKSFNLNVDKKYTNHRTIPENFTLMIDTFIYHTNIITKLSQNIALLFFGLSILAIVYSLYMKFSIDTVSGWTSTVIFVNLGFAAMFLLLAIFSRYLHHLIKNTTNSKDYIYREVIKKND